MVQHTKHFLNFCIAGFTYGDGIDVIDELKVGSKLELRREEDNLHDPNAVAIFYADTWIGYVPSSLNAQLSQLLYFDHDIFETVITQIDLEQHPERQVRVLVRFKDNRPKE